MLQSFRVSQCWHLLDVTNHLCHTVLLPTYNVQADVETSWTRWVVMQHAEKLSNFDLTSQATTTVLHKGVNQGCAHGGRGQASATLRGEGSRIRYNFLGLVIAPYLTH